MAQKENLAYDLSVFEPAQPNPKKEQQPIKKLDRRQSAKYISPVRSIALIVAVAVVTSFMVFSMIQLSELNDEIITSEDNLQTLQSESVRLDLKLNQMMSMSQLEESAESLGMVKINANNIEYITLSQGNVIEIPEDNNTTIFEKILTGFTNFMEYLTD